MGILDELKQQASEKRQQEGVDESRRLAQDERYREELLPKMQEIHTFLKQFIEHMNYVKPEVRVSVYDDGQRGLNDLLQSDYHLSTDEHGGQSNLRNLDYIRLAYHCFAEGEHRYTLVGKQNVENEMHMLSDAGISYSHGPVRENVQPEMVEEFSVLRKVPVMFEFRADAYSMQINLTIRNHESLGTRHYEIGLQQIGEPFMEEMANYILRRNNTFMTTSFSGDERKQLRKNYLEDKRNNSKLSSDEKRELKQLKSKLEITDRPSFFSRLFGRS